MMNMNTFQNILTLTLIASTDLEAYELVGFDDGRVKADDAPVKAIAMSPAKQGDAVSGLVMGTIQVKASGIVTNGQSLVSAAGGGVKTAQVNASNAFAFALNSAADGELVEILIR